jgi:hypothetical protein
MTLISRMRIVGFLILFALSAGAWQLHAQTNAAAQPEAILHAADSAKLLPGAVFFRGQSAATQLRNSGGIHFADGFYVLATLVDNSGYASGVQEKYQAYLLTEVSLEFDGHRLEPGAYGVGIVKGDNTLQFVAMDIGAHDLFQAHAANDGKLHRPTPLQIVAGASPGVYRLYFGRDYVEFSRAQ